MVCSRWILQSGMKKADESGVQSLAPLIIFFPNNWRFRFLKPLFTTDDVVMCDVFLTLQVALHQCFHTVKVKQLTTFSSGAPHTFLKL